MRGSRPLTVAEVDEVKESFGGVFALRDRALFLTGVKSGFRISELLSLEIRDVRPFRKIAERVTVHRRHMKKKTTGRTVPLHPEAQEALAVWIAAMEELVEVQPETKVFLSRKGDNRSITRQHAWRVLRQAYDVNELEGTLGTHAMRKTFAGRVYELLGRDLVKTQKALGHATINSTVSYLSFAWGEIEEAILAQ